MQGRFWQLCKEYQIPTTYTEPYSPWQNRAEGGIREIKRLVHRKMTSKRVPQKLWYRPVKSRIKALGMFMP
jgi:transposase